MDRLFVLVLLAAISCKSGNRLEIADLKFPDPEREFIRSNKVDTMFLFISQEDGTVLRDCKAYDEQGRITFDSTWGVSVRNYYDFRGLLVKRESEVMMDSIWYEFNLDSMLLKQRWSSGAAHVLFYFDDDGRIYRKIELERGTKAQSRERRTDYEYQGDLLTRCLMYAWNSEKIDIESLFYYSQDGKIDSATLRTPTGHGQSWIYDRQGLLMEERSNGNRMDIKFAYIRRR
ncbi:MAG TPA: hypothetical protein VEW65_06320 [Chryseolinea sp.]|nr:hypothetical protein [Chryseolinea sp.]